ncbi:hypothetical protein P175DRAFT_0560585 [Aspergillus ochraceoroseus IBT 24754]|uniref:Uncharacterized protein n=1 Tax=Aspergillus ochraceoroseus IBT 24754 TaxID=1392256 RepID=A0A2T5LNN7_9EURO|nr:uncharacterized protein P175DRAFT_0560585 [Aspergillus ochraceoroseus IBT 24754]PTU17896.1 hypothetical protein P175DRAFT_0560585 [Aspergillus ochraceoroseus IBT 24754]
MRGALLGFWGLAHFNFETIRWHEMDYDWPSSRGLPAPTNSRAGRAKFTKALVAEIGHRKFERNCSIGLLGWILHAYLTVTMKSDRFPVQDGIDRKVLPGRGGGVELTPWTFPRTFALLELHLSVPTYGFGKSPELRMGRPSYSDLKSPTLQTPGSGRENMAHVPQTRLFEAMSSETRPSHSWTLCPDDYGLRSGPPSPPLSSPPLVYIYNLAIRSNATP